MKSLIRVVLATLLLGAVAVTTASADADKGQRYYLKVFKPVTGFDGARFAAMHSQAEWEALFADNGKKFIEEWSAKYPDLKNFLESDKFQRILPDIRDFAVKYANDSGNIPSC